MDAEAQRRAEYERLYAALREARRSLETARAMGADAALLRRLRERLRALRARLAAWQCGLDERGTR